MDFKQIDALTVENLAPLLKDRILARGITEETIDEQILAIELEEYKDSLRKHELHNQVKNLIDNNCATVEAFPLAASNYKAWIQDNILDNTNIADAIDKLAGIQQAEISLALEISNNEYKVKRKAEYPDVMDYIDAQVKKYRVDLKEEGELQEKDYFEKCLAVKAKYPKAKK